MRDRISTPLPFDMISADRQAPPCELHAVRDRSYPPEAWRFRGGGDILRLGPRCTVVMAARYDHHAVVHPHDCPDRAGSFIEDGACLHGVDMRRVESARGEDELPWLPRPPLVEGSS